MNQSQLNKFLQVLLFLKLINSQQQVQHLGHHHIHLHIHHHLVVVMDQVLEDLVEVLEVCTGDMGEWEWECME
jgi:hypothetical protein